MKVVVSIDGRDAIPVRAIPLLTDWHVLSPDVCAEIFSGRKDTTVQYMEGLKSYRGKTGLSASSLRAASGYATMKRATKQAISSGAANLC